MYDLEHSVIKSTCRNSIIISNRLGKSEEEKRIVLTLRAGLKNGNNMRGKTRMIDNSGNIRRGEGRKRKRAGKRLFLIVFITLLAMLVSGIRNMKAELEEMQTILKRIEVLQYENVETTAQMEGETDYVDRIDIIDVEKPMKRTWTETLQRLDELGQINPMIAEISKNSSLYLESMLTALANNPEMADFVSGYLDGNKGTVEGLTYSEKEQEYPLFLQWDTRWGYLSYGDNSNIGLSGCGPTCMSMVLYYLTDDEMLTPDKLAAYAMNNNYYVEGTGTGTGTAWAFMEDIPPLYGIKISEPRVTERAIKAELDKGAVIICTMGEGDFTVSGHFIVIYGYDEAGFKVNDPNCVARSRKRWAFDEIEQQIKKIWAYQR
jgi:hypothetical protein